ncbi:hypothetical protein [Variovorax sp. RHLX14]|uniref:hypothetical protein n=1 Tax=Variovorax sp. RHLX14 TaxID=1259731 RepID=UPI003F498F11
MATFLAASPDAVAATPPAGLVIRTTATASYLPAGFSQIERTSSNTVTAVIRAVEALTLDGEARVAKAPDVDATLNFLLRNTGNVDSSYAFALTNGGSCAGTDNFDLSALRVVLDANNNGVADAIEPTLASAAGLTLAPGRTASLLIQGHVPNLPTGAACITLEATTQSQHVLARAATLVTIGANPVLAITKTAAFDGPLVPGASKVDFNIDAQNIGVRAATPTATASPAATPIVLNGVATSLVLLRDVLPVGTQYIAGTLRSAAWGAMRLFRLPGDPAFNYRTTEDSSAQEVAIGVASLAPNAGLAMRFSARVLAEAPADVVNQGQLYYSDGTGSTAAGSNHVVLGTSAERIGIAKSALPSRQNVDGSGALDGTATVRFSLLVRNYGGTPLFDVQVLDVLEGSAATAFGVYTLQPVPAVGQYTVVAGSVNIHNRVGSSTIAKASATFTGGINAKARLLDAGGFLPSGGEFVVDYDVRVHLGGRQVALLSSAVAQAARNQGSAPTVTDDSVDGIDPDPDIDGNPNNNASPTPIPTQLAGLSIVKTAGLPRRVAEDVYEIDYLLSVANKGRASAPNVRVIDNLECIVLGGQAASNIASWQLVGTPVARKGVLKIASTYTGRAPCDTSALASVDAVQSAPLSGALSLTDGSRALAVDQSEEIAFTVRVQRKSAAVRTSVENKAWAASFIENTLAPAQVLSAGASASHVLLVDPQGVVYDSVTRLPVEGAIVRFARQSCENGPAAAIQADQIYLGDSGRYTYAADGSVSMKTNAQGEYQLYWNVPPVADVCDYGVSVQPPPGSGYLNASGSIPPLPGRFATCGLVVPQATAPQGNDSTDHYRVLRSGFDARTNTACEAVHNHLPLDPPGVRSGLLLKKEGNKTKAELGDFVDYALQLTNRSGADLTGIDLQDTLPPGFAYVKGSTRFDGKPAADPAGSTALRFAYPAHTLANGATAAVRYRLRIGVGATSNGEAINRARGTANGVPSNDSAWRVYVSGGVFSDEAYAFGKVHLDCNRNGEQDGNDELGIPGVRLYMETGTSVITDSEGRWSLYGLKPVTHALRLDVSTLPAGARLAPWDHRNAGAADSRFVDVKKGEFAKANFLVDNCQDIALVEAVKARRENAAKAEATIVGAVATRLTTDNRTTAIGDVRSLPAAGALSSSGAAMAGTVPVAEPLVQVPGRLASNGGMGSMGVMASALLPPALVTRSLNASGTRLSAPPAAPGIVDLETVVPGLDAKPGFIELKDGDVVAARSVNVRVKGPLGAGLRLKVNGEHIPDTRVGKKASLPSAGVSAWEYIGVVLRAGVNALELVEMDDFGNARGGAALQITAPDELGRIAFVPPAELRADPLQPVVVQLRLTDAHGVAVTARTAVTLETDRGQWLNDDLNPAEPGIQMFIEGGSADLRLQPPAEPGTVRIRASTGPIVNDDTLVFLPALQPMTGIGIVEGVLDLRRHGSTRIDAPGASNAFEAEISGLSRQSGNARTAARAAYYFKGTVKGEYLLTTAFDSDKTVRDRLFRDIRPDELYPVYGDSSVKGFDAQSTQKLYVRIDKNRSYLLYGDFTTAGSPEVRELSQITRALTGIKHQYQSDGTRVVSYASRTSATQQIEEIAANGLSFYSLRSAGAGDIAGNSELVELLVRDRNQPSLVLSRTQLTRFTDYSFEPISGRLIFVSPIPSIDLGGNPQSIRVTYEVDNGGAQFLVAGTDAQVKLGDNLQLGAVAARDANPANARNLVAATGLARLGENTVVTGELVSTESDLSGKGAAQRLSVRHDSGGTAKDSGNLKAQAQVLHTDTRFDNPTATSAAGRTEITARADYRLDDTTHLRAEGLSSRDEVVRQRSLFSDAQPASLNSASSGAAATERRSISVAIQKRLGEDLVAEVGLRHGNYSGTAAGSFDYGQVSSTGAAGIPAVGSYGSATSSTANGSESTTTVRARLTATVPNIPQAQVFAEAEQDVSDSDRHGLGIGGTYALTEKTRLYGRYELASTLAQTASLGGTAAGNSTVLGIDSTYMEGGRVYNEYRLGSDSGAGQNATGLRNSFKVSDTLRLTAGFEHTRAFEQKPTTTDEGAFAPPSVGNSTAIATGADYANGPWRASGALEVRKASQQDSALLGLGVSYKLDSDWTALARSTIIDTRSDNGGSDFTSRQQLGFAWRPATSDRWNGLARYEHRMQRVAAGTDGNAAALDLVGVSANASLPGTQRTHIVSGLLNYNPQRGDVVTGRYAVKISDIDDAIASSRYWAQLVHLRYTRDIATDWDVGIQAGTMLGRGGARQNTLGFEVGYQALKNVWVSAGFNLLGLRDPDLAGADHTSQGVYLRLRFKFDEKTLGLVTPEGPTPVAVRIAYAPPVASIKPLRELDWRDGQVLPERVEWREDDIFMPGSVELTPEGAARMEALTVRLGAEHVGTVSLTVGHGDLVAVKDEARSNLWLARAAALRRVLGAQGPREIDMEVDSQMLIQLPPSATNDDAGRKAPRALGLAVVATPAPFTKP